MSEDLEDKESKTEDPTPKRLEEALEKGQVAYSKEVTSFLMLLTISIVSMLFIPFAANRIGTSLKIFVEHSAEMQFTQQGYAAILITLVNKALLFATPIFLSLVAIIILSGFFQHGQFIFAPDQLMPKLERISLKSGIGRLFSTKSFIEFLKGIFKVIVTTFIIYFVVMDDVKIMDLYPTMNHGLIINELYKVIKDILMSITIFMFVIGTADVIYQKYEHFKNLKMSRKEVKDEYKQTEGSPEIKKKRREKMQQLSKGRITEAVPKADVIITNPQHYSIALKYVAGEDDIPIIVAKGLDNMALRIREIAKDNDIPIVENPPLARALYLVDIDDVIPVEHYEAVAEIISYVYKLQNRTL